MTEDVEARLQLQTDRMDNIFESVQEAHCESANNAETLQTLTVAIENLGDNFQQMRQEMLQWNEPEQPMDTEEERAYDEAAAALLREVSLPLASNVENVSSVASTPISLAMSRP